jgi:hypothetical protein
MVQWILSELAKSGNRTYWQANVPVQLARFLKPRMKPLWLFVTPTDSRPSSLWTNHRVSVKTEYIASDPFTKTKSDIWVPIYPGFTDPVPTASVLSRFIFDGRWRLEEDEFWIAPIIDEECYELHLLNEDGTWFMRDGRIIAIPEAEWQTSLVRGTHCVNSSSCTWDSLERCRSYRYSKPWLYDPIKTCMRAISCLRLTGRRLSMELKTGRFGLSPSLRGCHSGS